MNISAATISSIQQSYLGIRPKAKQDFQSLTSALQSGDLKTAQSSFADLQKLLQSVGAISAVASSSSKSSSSSTSANPLLADLQQLGQDLSNGNLPGAQTDFNQLQTDATQQANSSGVGHHHHHHHFGGPPPPVTATSTTATTDPTSITSSPGAGQKTVSSTPPA